MKKNLLLLLALIFSSLAMAQTFHYKNSSPQQVHERRFVVYAKSGENLVLDIHPDDKWMYARWYNKKTGQRPLYVTGFVKGSSYQSQYQHFPNGGYIAFGGLDNSPSTTPSSAIYNRTYNGMSSGVLDEIVVDLSKYADYQYNYNSFTEPTLSVRYIFEIHPAAEKALPQRSAALTNTEIYGYNTAATEVRLCTDRPFIGDNADYYYTYGGTNVYNMSDPSKFELWKKVNNSKTIVCSPSDYRFDSDGQTIIVDAPNVTDDVWYHLVYKPGTVYNGGDGYYYQYQFEIAQFGKVVSFNQSYFGPKNSPNNGTIVKESDMRSVYGEPLAHISFDDYQGGQPITQQGHIIPVKTSYGHYNPSTTRTMSNDITLNRIQTGEYLIGSTAPDYRFSTPRYNDVEFNQAMFVNGSAFKQNILEFSAPAGFCAGTKTYWSVWVMGEANLNIEIQPMSNGNLVGDGPRVINTGFVSKNNGRWQQIKFSINDHRIFDEFKVRIYNNNSNSSTFAIGDINVYALPNPVKAYSVPVECYNSTAAITKFNYHGVTSNDYYYTWNEEDGDGGTYQLDLNYIKKQRGIKCGKITTDMFFQTENAVPTNLRYNSVEDMVVRTTAMEELKPESERFVDSYYYGYITENCIDYTYSDENRFDPKPVLYIIHYNNKMNKDQRMSLVKFSSNQNFSDDDCKMFDLAIPVYGAYVGPTENVKCINKEYEIRSLFLRAQYDASGKPVENPAQIICVNDVVIGNLSDTDAEGIRGALKRFRDEYPEFIYFPDKSKTPPNVVITPQGTFTQDDADLLTSLKDERRIFFNEVIHKQYLPYNAKVDITFFPIASAAYLFNEDSDEVTLVGSLCDNYSQFTLDGTVSEKGILLGKKDVTLPFAMELEPYVKRMYKDDPIEIPVKTVNGNDIEVYSAYLIDSNDPDFESGISYIKLNSQTTTPVAGRNIRFIPGSSTGNFYNSDGSAKGFKDGYYYRFKISNEPPGIIMSKGFDISVQKTKKQLRTLIDNNCDFGAEFTLKIIPEYVAYNGKSNAEDKEWNKDENWYVADRKGVKVSDACYVPGDRTKVFVHSDRVVLPEAENINSLIRFEDGFQANTCDTIHFHNAEMGYQHLLNYNAAIVDIDVKEKEWNLLGFPLKDMVSGDIFAEKTDAEDHFTVPEKGNAINVLVWQKLFNRNMQNMTLNGNVEVISTAWNTPANTVKERYNPGTAVLIWPSNNSNMVFNEGEITFHLPKRDTKYYYFNGSFVRTNINESVDLLAGETSRSSRLAYEVNANGEMEITLNATSPSTLFTFANPTLDLINLDEFFKANQGVIENKAYIIDGKEEAATVSPIAKIGLRFSANILSDQLKTNGYLSPTEAIMLHSKTKASSITVKVPVTALKAYMDRTSANTTPTKRMASAGGDATLYMKAECNDQVSYASVYVDGNADNDYVSKEDAEMIFIDNSTTPGAIYTVASGKALSINGLSAFSKVPMAVYTVDSNAKTAKVTFTGVDSFDGAISLLDITDGSVKNITEGDVLELATTNMNDNIRYYLQMTADIATDAELVTDNDAINVFVADGKIQVVANEDLKNVTVYNAAGQEIINNKANGRHASYTVSAGVYVVKAYTEDNQTTRKVVVD